MRGDIEHGLRDDFVEQLATTADTLRQLIDGRGATRAARVGTATASEAAIREGKKALRLIDNVLKVAVRDRETLDEWTSAKRIRGYTPPSQDTDGTPPDESQDKAA